MFVKVSIHHDDGSLIMDQCQRVDFYFKWRANPFHGLISECRRFMLTGFDFIPYLELAKTPAHEETLALAAPLAQLQETRPPAGGGER